MTPSPSLGTALLRRLISRAGTPELRALLRSAVQGESALRASDLLLVRDLVELTGETHPAFQALLLCLLVARDEGSLCVRLDEACLSRRLSLLAGPEAGQEWARRVLDSIESWPGHSRIFARTDDVYLPLVLSDTSRGTYVYFHRYWTHQRTLRAEVTRRIGRDLVCPDPATLDAVVHEVASSGSIRLNPEQTLAVRLALERPLVVVSGGPGTGKTAIVLSILRGMLRLGYSPDSLRLAAPTGRAGHRMTEAVHGGLARLAEPDARLREVTGTTIHTLLGYNPARGTFRYGAGNRLPIGAVIVDEVSMVDVTLMSRLLQAVPEDARVVLLGDKDQLPSVEAGAVLTDLMPRPTPARQVGGASRQRRKRAEYPVVLLTRNYRSQRHIQHVAALVNDASDGPARLVRSLPRFPLNPGEDWPSDPQPEGEDQPGGCFLLDAEGHEVHTWHRVLDAWAREHYLAARPAEQSALLPIEKACPYPDLVREFAHSVSWDDLDGPAKPILDGLSQCIAGARVLTLVRAGSHGCEGVNDYLCRQVAPIDPPGTPRAFSGMPLLVTRNDRATGLFNGDVGIALRARSGGLRAVFPRLGRYVTHALEALPPWEPAFAMTVHKSQGSEYDRVLVVLPPEGGRRLLSKEMIYTAVTRARHLAVIYARPGVLAEALANRVERDTGISLTDHP